MKCMVMGSRDLAVAALEALARAGSRTVQAAAALAEGESEWYESAAEWCASHGVPVLAEAEGADCVFVCDERAGGDAGRGTAELVYRVQLSLVPAHWGPLAVERCLIAGDKRAGVSLVRLGGSAQDDLLVDRAELFIAKDDDHLTLYRKLAALAGKMLDDILPKIKDGSARGAPLGPAAEAGAIDARIHWFGNSWDVYNKVRALTRPHEGAWSTFLGDKMIIWRAVPDDSGVGLIHPCEIEVEEGRVLAGASYGSLRLEEIEWRGLVYKGRRIAQAMEEHWMKKFE